MRYETQRIFRCLYAPFQAMGSIFAGLVQVGAWGCFDEFNRINIEVLSVVSAQLKAIQNSLISGKPTVDIGVGGEIKIKRVAGFATCGVFITMNPGYAGRTELPDNLKALFRPVTMIVPDLLQICEIMLFSEGFEAAKVRHYLLGHVKLLHREVCWSLEVSSFDIFGPKQGNTNVAM